MARHVTFLVMQIDVNPATFHLKVNYGYDVKVKRSETVSRLFSEHLFKSELSRMYEGMKLSNKGAVKITLSVSNFTSHHNKTFSLLDYEEDIREKELSVMIYQLREKFGLDILKTGSEL